jgi:hypothetical protein
MARPRCSRDEPIRLKRLISFSVAPCVRLELERMAAREMITLSALMRILLADALRRHMRKPVWMRAPTRTLGRGIR